MVPSFPEAARIPRVLHQAYWPAANLPKELAENVEWVRNSHPHWEHRFYDETAILNFVREHYGQRMVRYFERISPAYPVVKVDLFKYLLMYQAGGVYLDCKSRPTLPLDEVLGPDDRFILSHWRNGETEDFAGFGFHKELSHMPRGEYEQWHIVAAPGHPFLRAVIQRVLRNIDRYNPALNGAGQHGVLRLSGPIPYALAIEPLRARHPHRQISDATEIGLQYSIFGNPFTHRKQLGSHYSDRQDPIVEVGALTKASAPLIHAAKAVKKALRRARQTAKGAQPQKAETAEAA
ncbi:glycosyltransferase family 32 protein [Phenylobacterium deserti]|uniref:Glycosyltransferase n=1 Tax=Phenylobacterium deserti TaxID=1914756 RepID=A0A328AD03_9CAUL|nr:glycosyltransferase [Phenylobacterium deserti]RAK51274.1 glycosyltransferase [Phenylobacterium deserti]